MTGERGCVIVDIDGTIADNTVRKENAKRLFINDWMLGHLSPPTLRRDLPVADAVKSLRLLSTRYDIVYLTNRTEGTRVETSNWLAEYGYPEGRLLLHPDTLLFDPTFKPKTIKRLLSEGARIMLIYDDEEQYLNSYRRMGLPTYHIKSLSCWGRILDELKRTELGRNFDLTFDNYKYGSRL